MLGLRTSGWRGTAANRGLDKRSGESSIARLIPAGLAALMLGLVCGGTAMANTITVYSLVDPGNASTCALRDAITAANTKKAVNGCVKGNGTDTIVFAAGLSGTINLGSTLPTILNTLTIQGTATSPPAITISGGDSVQLLEVNAGATLNLSYLILTEGFANTNTGQGGGIDNEGTLNVANSTLSDNIAFDGGGIYNDGPLTVANSTFSANGGGTAGGGILNNSGTATVINSTFSENFANVGFGGGIFVAAGPVTVVNSTFADDRARFPGGAIFGSVNLEGTILASSILSNCAGGSFTDEGYNLSDDGSCAFSASTSQNNVANLDLGSLQFNGGPTETISIDSGSAAYDLIPVADCTYQNINPCTNPPTTGLTTPGALVCDQRGVTRPQATNCDAGAFELQETTEFTLDTGLIVFPLQFAAGGSITLASDAPAFNPVTQPVTITISSPFGDAVPTFGPLGVTIPPGSFKLVGSQYKYSGTIDGIKYGVSIGVPNAGGVSTFTFAVFGVEVTGITNNVSVTLQVGPNVGTDDVAAAIL